MGPYFFGIPGSHYHLRVLGDVVGVKSNSPGGMGVEGELSEIEEVAS